MKIKEYIEHLKKFDQDLEIIYAVDDEGNDYCPVYFSPSIFYKIDEDNYVNEDNIDEYYDESIYGEDIVDLDDWVESLEKVVCIN